MSHTIVYDRRFLKCGDRFIPMCLWGDSNVTTTNFRTGKEIRAREWKPFIYSDDMILGTEEEIMKIVLKFHPASSSDDSGGVEFHGKYLNDAEMVRFFRNGIAGAITLEDLFMQTSLSCITGKLIVYDMECNRDPEAEGESCYIRSSAELIDWVDQAKLRKLNILSGSQRHVYIMLDFGYFADPLKVSPVRDRTSPVVAYEKNSRRGQRNYVKGFTDTSTSYTLDFTEAFIFDNIDDAYARLPRWSKENLYFCEAKKAEVTAAAEPGKYVLSALYLGSRVYFLKKTRSKIYFSRIKANDLKRFHSEKEAKKWFVEKVQSSQPLFTDPEVVKL